MMKIGYGSLLLISLVLLILKLTCAPVIPWLVVALPALLPVIGVIGLLVLVVGVLLLLSPILVLIGIVMVAKAMCSESRE